MRTRVRIAIHAQRLRTRAAGLARHPGRLHLVELQKPFTPAPSLPREGESADIAELELQVSARLAHVELELDLGERFRLQVAQAAGGKPFGERLAAASPHQAARRMRLAVAVEQLAQRRLDRPLRSK